MSRNAPPVAQRRRGSRKLRATGVGTLFLGLIGLVLALFVPTAQATTSGETIAYDSSSCSAGTVSVTLSLSNVSVGQAHKLTSPQGTFYYEGTTMETENIYAGDTVITWQSAAPITTPAQITVTLERTSDSTFSNSVVFDNPCYVPVGPPPCTKTPSPGDGYTTPDDGCTWVPPVVKPPVVTPPVVVPPVVTPPVVNPPVVVPPANNGGSGSGNGGTTTTGSHTPAVASNVPVVTHSGGYPVGAGTSGQGTSLFDNTKFLAFGVVALFGLVLLIAPRVRRAKAGK